MEDKRELLVKWAEEEGVSVAVLLGYLIYLDNYNGGQRSLASLGWKMFQEEDESGNEGYSDQKQGYKNRADRGGYTEMKEQIYQVKVYLTPYYSSHISEF